MTIPQHPLISDWYAAELMQPYAQYEAGVVISMPVWGDAYVERFFDYALASMCARRNRAALSKARAELVVYTDAKTCARLRQDLPFIPGFVRMIPDSIMQLLTEGPQYKYTVMTAIHGLGLAQAAKKGASFSPGFADVVYSENYFGRLFELGATHDAIAHLAFNTSQTRARTCLDEWRLDGVLDLSAATLGALGWQYASKLMQSWNMNDIATFEEMPRTHFVLWRGLDYVCMHCPHLTPMWLSPEYCRRTAFNLNDTLDALPIGDCHVPTLADDMALVTLDDIRDDQWSPRVPFEMFRDSLRPFVSCMAQFTVPVIVPTLPAQGEWLPTDVIEQRAGKLFGMLGL